MAHLEKVLNFPNVRAILKVSTLRRFILWGPPRWTLELLIPGPDARFNAAYAALDHAGVRYLSTALDRAFAELGSPVGLNTEARYHKSFGYGVSVEKQSGKAWVSFTLSSGTRSFSRNLSVEQVKLAVALLKSVPDQAERIAGAV